LSIDQQPQTIESKGATKSASRHSLGEGRFLLSYYRPYAGRMIAALLLMLPSAGVSLVFPRLTGTLIDDIVHSADAQHLWSVGFMFLGLLSAQAVTGYIVSITLAKTTERVIATLRASLFNHIVRLPLGYLTGQRVGELASRISSDLTQIQETFTFSILQFLRQGVFFIGSLAIIISTSLSLTVPIVLGTPLIVAAALIIGRKIRRLSTETQQALAVSSTIVEETLQSIASVKSFVREGYEAARYREALDATVRLAIRTARLRALFVTFIVFTIFGGIAAVIMYGAGQVAAGAVTIGELLSFLMYAMFVGGAMGSFAEVYGQIQKSLGAAVRIRELFQQPTEELDSADTGIRYSSVELQDVHFAYPGRDDVTVLKGISISIKGGQRVAFVGESGSGKSTTAAIIQRLYEPTSGAVLYNGQIAHELSITDVRRTIGIVPQDIVLFGGTIGDNIRYGNLGASDAELRSAAQAANALEFIESFPDGFNTVVGERGIRLSGGQRQRVAIARAVLKNPPILVLDEATSSLDPESEHLIAEALERLMEQRTTIIIAHRLSTVRTCDVIYVFAGGQIVEQGTHAQLFELADGRYRRWCLVNES